MSETPGNDELQRIARTIPWSVTLKADADAMRADLQDVAFGLRYARRRPRRPRLRPCWATIAVWAAFLLGLSIAHPALAAADHTLAYFDGALLGYCWAEIMRRVRW